VSRSRRDGAVPDPRPHSDSLGPAVSPPGAGAAGSERLSATRVRPAATPETAREYAGRDGWIAGGEPGDDDPASAVSNAPTRIVETDVDGLAACLHSINGAQAVDTLADRDVFVGTTLNARAVADAVAAVDPDRVVVVAVGYDGPAAEDLIAGSPIARYLREDDLPDHERMVYRSALDGADIAAQKEDRKDREDGAYVADLDTSTVVPRLVDGAFADAG